MWQVLTKHMKLLDLPGFEHVRAMLLAPLTQISMLVSLILLTGMRIGEVLALRWSDIDWQKGVINVETSVSRHGEDEDKTKTAPGQREIPLFDEIARRLRRWFEVSGGTPDGFVLGYANLPVPPYQVAYRALQDWLPLVFLEGARPSFTFTQLRHACAALWIWLEVPDDAISAWLGHSNVYFTLDTYGYLFELLEEGAPTWPTGPADLAHERVLN